MIDLGNSSVECDDVESMVGGVQDQVLTHDGQTDQTEVTSRGIVSIVESALHSVEACAGFRVKKWMMAG